MPPSWEPFDWYRNVRYYDAVFDRTTGDEIEFLEGAVARYGRGPSGRRVLEPGCGSGRLVAGLVERGWSVHGYDLRAEALIVARRRVRVLGSDAARATRLRVGRFDRFAFDDAAFDLAHCLYSTIQHATREGEIETHLRLVCDALRIGGLYVIGLHLADYERREPIRERADCRRGPLRVLYTLRHGPPDRRTRTQPMRCRLAVQEPHRGGMRHRRLESSWTFRTYDEWQLRSTLASEPRFRLVATHDYHHDLDSSNVGPDRTFDRVLVLRRER